MGLLDNFEERLDQLVSGTLSSAFKGDLEPIEIASRIQREMDTRAAIVSRGRTLVPNVFTVELSTEDFQRLEDYTEPLRSELSQMTREYATAQRYSFLGATDVRFKEEPTLKAGVIRVRSQAKPDSGASMHASVKPIVPQETTGHPRLVVGAQSYPLAKSQTRIGRGAKADIPFDDPGVSRAHADIILSLPVVIRDLGSTNGTMVDGRRISEAPLHDGAVIQVGPMKIIYRDK